MRPVQPGRRGPLTLPCHAAANIENWGGRKGLRLRAAKRNAKRRQTVKSGGVLLSVSDCVGPSSRLEDSRVAAGASHYKRGQLAARALATRLLSRRRAPL